MKSSRAIYFLLILGIFLSFPTIRLSSQTQSPKSKDYYKKCTIISLKDPLILKMADTLISYSRDEKYPTGETMALFLKLRHHITNNDLDSILYYTQVVKNFTRKHNQKNYYYLAWRYLANYYIDNSYFDLALKEIDMMPIEAAADKYIQGVIESYGMLAILYNARGLYEKAIENMEKAIAMDKEYNIKDYNLFNKYYILNTCYLNNGDYVKAEECLSIGLENSLTDEKKSYIFRGLIKLYLEKGEYVKAKQYLDTTFLSKYHPERSLANLLSLKAQYYSNTGKYADALKTYMELSNERLPTNETLRDEAFCLKQLGKIDEANRKLVQALDYQDSIAKVENEQDIAEQMVLMEVDSISAEKEKIASRLRESRLHYAKIIIITMVVILLFFLYLVYRYQQLNKSLKKSESIKNSFINHLSHEIRTPLNAIVGFSDLISDDKNMNKEEQHKCATIIRANTNSLLDMISNAMDITDIDTMGEAKKTSINEICQTVILDYQEKVGKDVSLIINPCKKDRICILNSEKITKILRALLDNSVKFTKEGSITVDANINQRDNLIVVSVSDTGPGIPAEKHSIVFEFFEKLNTFDSGLGIGLPISRLLAESMNGTLKIDKHYTTGTRIILSIPFKQTTATT